MRRKDNYNIKENVKKEVWLSVSFIHAVTNKELCILLVFFSVIATKLIQFEFKIEFILF